jgi:hypothetical protein
MEIDEIIRRLAGTNGEKSNEWRGILATVVSVSGTTCTVSPVDDSADIEDVRLQAQGSSGVLCVPATGSIVIVQMISEAEGYIAMFSELESIQFLDGSFGGLTKTLELKTQIEKSNEVLQIIMQVLTTWTPVSSDGGAALKAAAISALAGKAVGDFSQIENESITHGV